MRIHGLVVCVDYAEQLAQSIARWRSGLATLWVVTNFEDQATVELAAAHSCGIVRTGAFTEDGAFFNKARAMQEARPLMPADDWHLFLDADVIPPEDWLRRVTTQVPSAGVLHGAKRIFEDGRPVPDFELGGFFQLFHSSDLRAKAPLDRDWVHAGNYDSRFMARWPAGLQRILDLTLVHLGEVGKNWCGKGNDEAMEQIRERRRTKSWRTETVTGMRPR